MTRRDTPTVPAGCPDDRAHGCGAVDRCGACGGLWPRCGCGGRPRTTAPLPPPDAVVAARLLRAERATHTHRVDRIDEALRTLLAGMSPAQRRELDG